MRLESFSVQGFRSLADVQGIPLRQPTILTGHNDAGKSATLAALGFLLDTQRPTDEDRTFICDPCTDTTAADRRASEVVVTGEFILAEAEQKELDLPEIIQLRRRMQVDGLSVYEIMRDVPVNKDLRGIENMKLADLKDLAANLGIAAAGPATRLDSWREPLVEFVERQEKVQDWVAAPRDIASYLPLFLSFSSMDEPDPESQIREVLRASYQRMLEDPEFSGKARDLEAEVGNRLQAEALQLCEHIQRQVPELTKVSAIPEVSFQQGFRAVHLRAYKGEEDVGLQRSGAGRKRRISLAVWEWTSLTISEDEENQRDRVIVYDEPDTHLDYARQRELVDLIHAQCTSPWVRMIVATHSLNLIDRVNIVDVVQLDLDDQGRTRIDRLVDESHEAVDQYLSQISVAMGLRTSVLLHERCFLAVEGQTEEQIFPLLFRLATGRHLQSAGIALICGKSNDGALKVTQFLIEHGRAVMFIVDKDSNQQKVFSNKKLLAHGVKTDQICYIGDPNELEELFSDAQWADTANAEWPRKDDRQWDPAEIAALRQNGKFSDELKKLIWQDAEHGPQNKQEMALKLVLRLRSREDVPEQLLLAFEAATRLAAEGVKR
jgi:putative ATP-dependent endonuclease of the OLD family